MRTKKIDLGILKRAVELSGGNTQLAASLDRSVSALHKWRTSGEAPVEIVDKIEAIAAGRKAG